MNTDYYKQALKTLVVFCLYLALTRFTNGAFLVIMALMGCVYAFNSKIGKAISLYVMIIFMTVTNPNILPKNGAMYGLGLRFGPLLIGFSLVLRGVSIRSNRRLPLGMLLAYLLIAAVSSINGWAPEISFLKLINFAVFFMGIWLGTQSLEYDVDGVKVLRSTFFSIAIFLVVGSIAILPFPGISTLSGLQMISEVGSIVALNELLEEAALGGAMPLFCGVTSQSQVLSPLLASIVAWVICDMLFVEERIQWPHLALIVLALPILYKTRSRSALLTLFVSMMLIYFYLPRRLRLSGAMRRKIGTILLCSAFILSVLMAVAEIHGDAISKWIRKTNDVEADKRSMSEAFTASRQGLIEECMEDFRRNPAFGSGFQVSWFTAERAKTQKGLVLSAPIEKGVLPVMVLGETGIVGEIVFVAFLVSFFISASHRRLYISIATMCVFLATNFSEASYFSPGGLGGVLWIACVVGGYSLDMSLALRERFASNHPNY